MRLRPISPESLAREVVERILGRSGWVRVGVDGADAARPGDLADALVELVQVSGRAALGVRTADHLRPASLRYERGRADPDSFYQDWLDAAGLRREVLDPLEPGGTGRVRPARWDAIADRASRSGFVNLPPGGVLVLSGPFLLGGGLPLDLTVHLELSPAALARRTPPELAWTLPAYATYSEEVMPTLLADVVVRMNDARHPALVEDVAG